MAAQKAENLLEERKKHLILMLLSSSEGTQAGGGGGGGRGKGEERRLNRLTHVYSFGKVQGKSHTKRTFIAGMHCVNQKSSMELEPNAVKEFPT